ncbi:hypothetical protein GF336_01305 [Candidatus Woesearchaeota archaeon]|nr:hypothetical protein [Candidatus Woesearchaeota archaeon]
MNNEKLKGYALISVFAVVSVLLVVFIIDQINEPTVGRAFDVVAEECDQTMIIADGQEFTYNNETFEIINIDEDGVDFEVVESGLKYEDKQEKESFEYENVLIGIISISDNNSAVELCLGLDESEETVLIEEDIGELEYLDSAYGEEFDLQDNPSVEGYSARYSDMFSALVQIYENEVTSDMFDILIEDISDDVEGIEIETHLGYNVYVIGDDPYLGALWYSGNKIILISTYKENEGYSGHKMDSIFEAYVEKYPSDLEFPVEDCVSLVEGETYRYSGVEFEVEAIDADPEEMIVDLSFGELRFNKRVGQSLTHDGIRVIVSSITQETGMEPSVYLCMENVPTEESCIDSDGGKNYYVKGIVLWGDESRSQYRAEDKCGYYIDGVWHDNLLDEHYCNGTSWSHESYECPNGCEDGACVILEEECTDSDSGKNYYVKGTVDTTHGIYEDQCIGEELEDGSTKEYVMEYFCNPESEDVSSIEYECTNGCEDGACIEAGTTYNVILDEGWNLFSIPYVLVDKDIENVFADIKEDVEVVYTYKAESGWKVWNPDPNIPSNLETIEPGIAYWIYMEENSVLNTRGTIGVGEPEVIPTFDLDEGWNLVGIHSEIQIRSSDALENIEGKYSSLWTYEAGQLRKLNIDMDPLLEPGKGYWIYMKEAGTIVP